MAAPAPNAPAAAGPGATALANLDNWLLGDSSVVFLAKMTVRDIGTGSKVLYAQVSERRNPNLAGAWPRLILPGVSVSVINSSFGRPDSIDSRVNYEQFRAGKLQFGSFEIINTDGTLDAWTSDYSWADAEVLLQVGLETDALGSFKTLMPMMVLSEPTWTLRGNLRFLVKGASGVNLNRPIQETTFAGTGGLEGGADLTGKTKPILIGKKDNIRPVLVDSSTVKYMIDPDGVASIGTVYEGGLSVGGGVTKSAANGWFTLDTVPTEVITCDATGKDRRSVGATANEVWNLIDSVVQDFAGGAAISRAGMAYDGGVYLETGGSRTYESVMTELARPSGIYYPAQDNSKIHLAELFGGSPTSAFTYTDKHIESIDRLETAPPVYSFRVGYRPLDHLLSNILPGVTDAEKDRLSAEHRFYEADDATVLTDFANGIAVESLSSLYDLADATSTGDSLLTLLKSFRNIYRIRLARHPLAAWLLALVTIDIDAFDFSGGKDVMVVGWDIDLADRGFSMTVFG